MAGKGETSIPISEWSTGTLKAYSDMQIAYERQISDIRETNRKEVSALQRRYNDSHFSQLNENAKRTIEERGHFVSLEAFVPFQRQVLEFMAAYTGQAKGSDKIVAYVIAGIGILTGIAGLIFGLIR